MCLKKTKPNGNSRKLLKNRLKELKGSIWAYRKQSLFSNGRKIGWNFYKMAEARIKYAEGVDPKKVKLLKRLYVKYQLIRAKIHLLNAEIRKGGDSNQRSVEINILAKKLQELNERMCSIILNPETREKIGKLKKDLKEAGKENKQLIVELNLDIAEQYKKALSENNLGFIAKRILKIKKESRIKKAERVLKSIQTMINDSNFEWDRIKELRAPI